jgi:phytoene dehydrogenase-like protein
VGLPPRVVVVGGGLAGLTAALQLARLGAPTLLFHDTAQLGGRARTECRSGFHLNFGPHRLYERGAAVQGMRALAIAVKGAPRGPNGGLAIRGGIKFTLPVGCLSLLMTGLLSPSGKREIASFLAGVPTIDLSQLQGVSVTAWITHRLRDPNALQVALAMIRSATYCDDPDRLSAAAGIEQLRLSLTGPILYIHRGWGTLVTALEDAAESSGATLVTRQAVTAITVNGRRAVSVALEDGTLVPCEAVIVATDPQRARGLLGDLCPR